MNPRARGIKIDRWQATDDDKEFQCPICEHYFAFDPDDSDDDFDEWRYCPHCGARLYPAILEEDN